MGVWTRGEAPRRTGGGELDRARNFGYETCSFLRFVQNAVGGSSQQLSHMTKLIPNDVRGDGRLAQPDPAYDRKSLSEVIDLALKYNRFCDVERALIVQIVCDALLPATNGTNGKEVQAGH